MPSGIVLLRDFCWVGIWVLVLVWFVVMQVKTLYCPAIVHALESGASLLLQGAQAREL